MPLKRPVTVAQARRWPASAKRRESFCARMGGMRERLTSPEVAADPASAINRSLAAWDCDDPEGLRPEHVSKGIRMKVTMSKVGSETRGRAKAARRNPADPAPYTVTWKSSVTRRINSSSSRTKAEAVREARALAREGEKDISVSRYSPETGAVEIEWRETPPKSAAQNPAPKVWSVFADRAENPVAMFRTREDAVTFAQARANTTGKQMRVAEE